MGCHKLSIEALKLYQAIVSFPEFSSLEKSGKNPAFVDSIKDVCSIYYPLNSIFNDDCHSLPDIMSVETGVACGGGGPNKMLKHAFLIASLQKYCIDKGYPICPDIFNNVAVLSPSLDKVVAHVTGGLYVQPLRRCLFGGETLEL